MNKQSSRSHSIFMTTVVRKVASTSTFSIAQLFLVDLAGSENEKSGVTNTLTRAEASSICFLEHFSFTVNYFETCFINLFFNTIEINTSLFALKSVIKHLCLGKVLPFAKILSFFSGDFIIYQPFISLKKTIKEQEIHSIQKQQIDVSAGQLFWWKWKYIINY